jgi:hypothetical protein
MLEERDNQIIARLPGREVVVARLTDADRYRALLSYNVKPVIAQAVAAKLITIRLTA